MQPILIIIAVLSFLAAAGALSVAESVFHEMLGAILFLTTTVSLAAVGIIRAVEKEEKS